MGPAWSTTACLLSWLATCERGSRGLRKCSGGLRRTAHILEAKDFWVFSFRQRGLATYGARGREGDGGRGQSSPLLKSCLKLPPRFRSEPSVLGTSRARSQSKRGRRKKLEVHSSARPRRRACRTRIFKSATRARVLAAFFSRSGRAGKVRQGPQWARARNGVSLFRTKPLSRLAGEEQATGLSEASRSHATMILA